MTSNKLFLLHPEKRPFLDGENRHLSDGLPVGCWSVPVAISLGAMLAFWAADFQGKRVGSFKKHRAVVQGRLSSPGMVDVDTGMIPGGEDNYLLTYRFDMPVAGGQKTFTREASVSKEEYDKLRLGDRVRVIYDAANPSFSVMQCEGEPTEPFLLVVFGYSLLAAPINAAKVAHEEIEMAVAVPIEHAHLGTHAGFDVPGPWGIVIVIRPWGPRHEGHTFGELRRCVAADIVIPNHTAGRKISGVPLRPLTTQASALEFADKKDSEEQKVESGLFCCFSSCLSAGERSEEVCCV